MEAKNLKNEMLNTKEYCFSFYSYPKYSPYFGNDISNTKTDNLNTQRQKWGKNYSYRIQNALEGYPNIVLLTPAIFGGLGAFMVSSLLSRRRPRGSFANKDAAEVSGHFLETHHRGFYKLELFLNILSIIALLGCTAYVYQEIKGDGGIRRFAAVVPTVVIIISLFTAEAYLLYTVWPGSYEGVTGNSEIGDLLNFVALNIGAISVGQSYGITANTTGARLLLAQESLFNLFVIVLLISFIVS